jgi:hypothetical protein
MFYDVSVTRTSTATRTIRVEADDMESARGAALELAGDQDYSGCVVEYDFDANEVTEVKDENTPDCADETMPEGYGVADETAGDVNLASEEARCPDLGDGVCSICRKTPFPGVSDEVIDAGWIPSYFEGEDEYEGPVCPNCVAQFIRDSEDGEWELRLKGEYVSVWDGGVEVRSICTVDPRTRKIVIEHVSGVEGLETMEREFVALNGEEYKAVNEEYRNEYTPEERSQMFFWE